jgi:endonuclease/exonuclease/phosphatase (EEP) superfamily protein YafD
LAAVAAIAMLANAAVIVASYSPAAPSQANGPRLRVISFNVLTRNEKREDVLAFLRAQNADVVLLMEVDAAWGEAVERLSDLYSHRHIVPRSDNFGIALLSRIPWTDARTKVFGDADVPTIVARLDLDQHAVVIIGTHPLPPGSRIQTELRDEQLAKLAQFIRAQEVSVILAGDLNTTDFSPCFSDLLVASGLKDTRQGRGIQASWGPFPLLEIPIDHCLVSPEIDVVERSVGPHLGSDHRPVIVDLRFPTTD